MGQNQPPVTCHPLAPGPPGVGPSVGAQPSLLCSSASLPVDGQRPRQPLRLIPVPTAMIHEIWSKAWQPPPRDQPRFCLCPAAPLRGHRPTSAPHAQAWPLPHPPSPHPTAACPHPCPIPSPVTCGSAPPCPPLAGHTAPLLNWTPSPQDVALTPKPRCCSVVGLSAPCAFPNCPRQAGTVPIAPAHVVPSS